MATNGTNNGGAPKDERRRRLAERGSDRMALITGRIQALPPTAPSTAASSTPDHLPPRHTRPQSLSAAPDHHPDLADDQLPPRHARPQSLSSADYHLDNGGGAEDKHDGFSSFARLKHQTGFRYANLDNFHIKSEEELLIQDSDDTNSEANHQMSVDDGDKIKPSPVISSHQIAAVGTQKLPKPGRHKPTFFSSRELNSCILASETTRALSALIIASLVVFFYMISESLVTSRPLYIVLLTDITIVLSRLYREKARASEEAEGERIEVHEDARNWADAVKLMERGLVAYQAIRGVFIDCSIYVVGIVCGTSLM